MPGWLQAEAQSFREILSLRPELQQRYGAFLDAVESSDQLPERILTLCRARIRQIHGAPADSVSALEAEQLAAADFSAFTEDEQVALCVAEKMPYQHHQLQDDEVDRVRSSYGEAGCVSLLTALAFFDVTCRLELTLGVGES